LGKKEKNFCAKLLLTKMQRVCYNGKMARLWPQARQPAQQKKGSGILTPESDIQL